ncbi:MAG: PQQ-dependent sugar dehydrogenase [Planctomycetes bacterium]|nr:PQQ-dependent sugar dehydrogenase [Planctomycetota bacterium]
MIYRTLPAVLVVSAVGVVTVSPALGQRGEVIVEGLAMPVDAAADPTHADRFFIVEQKTGDVRIVQDGRLLDEPFLHLDKSRFDSGAWEQGLLGIALDPAYAENGYVYLNYTNARGDTHVSRFKADSPTHLDPDSEAVIIKVDQPYANHNGGCIRFGPDGMLYIGMGDGGLANDPKGNAQNRLSLLGKMLRIDVSGAMEPGQMYRAPADNPFAALDDAQPEIWALGLRNPWKFEFDSLGRMWIADVGQNKWEWVHLQPTGSHGGENYGWNVMEGPEAFERRPGAQKDIQPDPATLVKPVWAYRQRTNRPEVNHGRGDGSITGGYFYENDTIPALTNRYIFADFMSGRIWSFKLKKGTADDVFEHTADFADAFPYGPTLAISSFARDNQGELYILDHKGGRLLKIVP